MASFRARVNNAPVTVEVTPQTDGPNKGRTRLDLVPDDPQASVVVRDYVMATGGGVIDYAQPLDRIVVYVDPARDPKTLPFISVLQESRKGRVQEGAVVDNPADPQRYVSSEKGEVEMGGGSEDLDNPDVNVIDVTLGEQNMAGQGKKNLITIEANGKKFRFHAEETGVAAATGVQSSIPDPRTAAEKTTGLDNKARTDIDPKVNAKGAMGPGEKPTGAESEGQDLGKEKKGAEDLSATKGSMGPGEKPKGITGSEEDRQPKDQGKEPAPAKPLSEMFNHPVWVSAHQFLSKGKMTEAMGALLDYERKLVTSGKSVVAIQRERPVLESMKAVILGRPASPEGSYMVEGTAREQSLRIEKTLTEGRKRTQDLRRKVESAIASTDVASLRSALKDVKTHCESVEGHYALTEKLVDASGRAVLNKNSQMKKALEAVNRLTGVEAKTFTEAVSNLSSIARELRYIERNYQKSRAQLEGVLKFTSALRSRVRKESADRRALYALVQELRTRVKDHAPSYLGEGVGVPKAHKESVELLIQANPEMEYFREELERCPTREKAELLAEKCLKFMSDPSRVLGAHYAVKGNTLKKENRDGSVLGRYNLL